MIMDILQAAVFLLLAIPFMYMAFDVGREVSVQTIKLVNDKVRPGVNSLLTFMLK